MGNKKVGKLILPTFATAILYRIGHKLGNPAGSSQEPFRQGLGIATPASHRGPRRNTLCRNSFAKCPARRHHIAVTQPLALIFYQKLLPGSTLANRLRDMNYRVHAASSPAELLSVAQGEGPMLLLAEVSAGSSEVCEVIRSLRSNSKTAHVPILAFAEEDQQLEAARTAGATLAASDAAMNSHLEQLLEQVLRLD